MSKLESRQLGNKLKHRYLLAISIILFLVILGQVLIQVSIYSQQDDSRVINIAGRQRMLSQKINKAAFGLYISTENAQQTRYREELEKALNLWVTSHRGLQQGDTDLGLPGINTPTVTDMFKAIEAQHQSIAAAANGILEITATSDYKPTSLLDNLKIIQDQESSFLKGMDAIVFQYDAEAHQKTKNFKMTELMVLLITILTLIMEVLYIFRPIKHQIESTMDELELSRNNLERLFETAPAALFLLDSVDFHVKKLNHLAHEILGITADELQTIDFKEMLSNNKQDVKTLIDQLIEGVSVENKEMVLQTSDNLSLVVLLSSNLINYDDQSTILLGLSDITRLKEAEEVLKRYATIDDLTGFLNKRSGMLVLGNAFDRVEGSIQGKPSDEALTVCFMDIDGLKTVNDTFGHEEGDRYIQTISKVLKASVNAKDTLFRYGGDEIVLVLSGCNRISAEAVASRIMKNLEIASAESGLPYIYHLSIGIAVHGEGLFDSPEAMLTAADHEMYEVKRLYKQTMKA